MEGLKDLIRNLAIILLLASFLEMLLPNKKMRGYVQLVMGLFIISALINPISQLLHLSLDMEIPAWNSSSQEDLPVLADGQKSVNNPIQEQYRLILTNQIRALTLGVQGVGEAKVEVAFEETAAKMLDQPQILRVDITLTESDVSIQSVKPVIIGEVAGGESELESNALAERVKERVVSLMQIPEDKVQIHLGT